MTEYSNSIFNSLITHFPTFEDFMSISNDLLVIDKPAEKTSNIGGIVIQTTYENKSWIRIYHPYSGYSVDNIEELVEIIEDILADKILWVIAYKGDEWFETTLIQNVDQIEIESGISYNILSWSGKLDKTFTAQ